MMACGVALPACHASVLIVLLAAALQVMKEVAAAYVQVRPFPPRCSQPP